MAQRAGGEQRVVLDTEEVAAAAIAAVEGVGGEVRHRWPGVLVVVVPETGATALQEQLPEGARLVDDDDPSIAASAATGRPAATERLEDRAMRRRQSPEFRARKANRPHDGREWGTGDLDAPDAGDENDAVVRPPPIPGPAVMGPTAAVVPQRNERMINSIAVGIVLVDGVNAAYKMSDAEQVDVVAEVQEGLGWLGSQEPKAKVTWIYDTEVVTVDPDPWKGARWPGMPESFYKGIDAALLREDNGKIYFFLGDQYVRFSSVSAGVDAGYPKPISEGWKGMPAGFNAGIDAALWRQSNGKIYLFKGDQYVRISDVSAGMDAGYPKPIAGNWPGLPASFNEGIDAALLRKDNGKIYFFKDDEYVRYSNVSAGVDAGYPAKIAANWKGMPDSFNDGIDAALWRNSNSSVYLFNKGRFYGRYVRFSDVSAGVDAGYEDGVPIGLSTEEAEALWRDPALAKLGHPAGSDGYTQYVDALLAQHGTKWGVVAFVTKHPVTWFAYANTPKIVMHHGSDGISDRVFAHETGHMFGAPDEYASSNCTCGKLAGRFFSEPNDNCANCADPGVPCIMKSNSSAICPNTPKHFGWSAFMSKIDAAVWRVDVDKAYLFSNDSYVRFTDISSGRDEGYPTLIAGNWPGLPATFKAGIDAALWRESNGKLYLFKGDQYVRFSKVSDGVDAGYPKAIAGNWPGMPATFNTGIDAALWRESNGKIYFFKGSQYVRFSNVSDGVDPGYPKPIAGSWPGMPASFNSGIDAALMRKDNQKIYFFKGRTYVRFSSVSDGVDPGYPAWIDGNWMPFPR